MKNKTKIQKDSDMFLYLSQKHMTFKGMKRNSFLINKQRISSKNNCYFSYFLCELCMVFYNGYS